MIGPDLSRVEIFIRPGITDMRKQVNGLSIIASEEMELDPLSGALFLFCNRYRRIIKALYWDATGFCLWQLCEASHNCHYVEKNIMRSKPRKQW